MSTDEPTLALPVQVLERLRTADSLRAEVAGLTAERDALRAELDRAAWERDTAQSEAAYLREDVLNPWNGDGQRLGLILTTGDVPPPPPEDDSGEDIALVSLSTSDLYVRVDRRNPDQWSKFGQGMSFSDWATLGERGPWVTVSGWRIHQHKQAVQQQRELRSAMSSTPNLATWPESVAERFEAVRTLGDGPSRDRPQDWIEGWRMLANATRSAWEDDHKALERAQAVLREIPHEPRWQQHYSTFESADDRCVACDVARAEHIEVPAVTA